MNRRSVLAVLSMIFLAALLTACTEQKTELRFNNQTECGTATITLTNMATGNMEEHTVDQGQTLTLNMDANVTYQYEVVYPSQPNYVVCESKQVTTALEKGQRLTVRLESVRDPSLDTPTPASE